MKLKAQNIDNNNSTVEGEEIYAPEAKQVEACDFQSQGVGSSPIRSTNDDHMIIGNGDQMVIGKSEEEIGYMKKQDWNIGFTTKRNDIIVAGRTYPGLSVLRT